jgi:hypothetical protein
MTNKSFGLCLVLNIILDKTQGGGSGTSSCKITTTPDGPSWYNKMLNDMELKNHYSVQSTLLLIRRKAYLSRLDKICACRRRPLGR